MSCIDKSPTVHDNNTLSVNVTNDIKSQKKNKKTKKIKSKVQKDLERLRKSKEFRDLGDMFYD